MKALIKKYDGSTEEVRDVLSMRYNAEDGFLTISYADAAAKDQVGVKLLGSGQWRSVELAAEGGA